MLRNDPAITVLFLFGKKVKKRQNRDAEELFEKSFCSFQAVNGFDGTDTDDDRQIELCVRDVNVFTVTCNVWLV